ncbi:hypothetical protein B0T14DRAFT_602663 [Immersiella caudata]|uniref:Uncharacterized protein n=1 Tax=Immersiella caudata TaxID=314043 RepID=A0AA39WZ71_9PEZI|nr:hypothetical protein B0T14DRAFT_602663 [Immersiella caudata]
MASHRNNNRAPSSPQTFLSPDIVRRVLESNRARARAEGLDLHFTEAQVRNSLMQSADALGSAAITSLQDHHRIVSRIHDSADLETLTLARAEARIALAAAPNNARIRAVHHNGLAILLRMTFDKTHSLRHINETIGHGRSAVSGTDEIPSRSLFQSHFARSLASRFSLSASSIDLDEAARVGRAATFAIPTAHPNAATRWNNMAHVLTINASSPRGTITDINQAIECDVNAISGLSPNDQRKGQFYQEIAALLL